MPYQESVQSKIARLTNTVQGADLGTTMFITANNYTKFRALSFGSIQEVRENPAILKDSNAYTGLLKAFTAGASRVLLGRRLVDSAFYAPDVDRIGKVTVYNLTVSVADETFKAEYTSNTGDEALDIVSQLAGQITSAAIGVDASPFGTGADATLQLTDIGTDVHVVSDSSNLTAEYTSTETAAECIAAILEQEEENFYFVTAEDHTEAFTLEMAAEIEATDNSNYPKQYHTSVQEAAVITPPSDPAVDTLAKLKALGYTRTLGQWNDKADTEFPEVFVTAYRGQYTPGTTNWKFTLPKGIAAAADPTTGKRLGTGKQGYIDDRNANWFGVERGTNFFREGKMASGEWVDVIRTVDYINDLIEVRLLNLQINKSVNGKISFTKSDKLVVANVVDGVLKQCVDLKILTGYIPTVVPDQVPFEDQANRILRNINWTGFLAGAVNTLLVNGVLTYEDETLA